MRDNKKWGHEQTYAFREDLTVCVEQVEVFNPRKVRCFLCGKHHIPQLVMENMTRKVSLCYVCFTQILNHVFEYWEDW